MLALREHLHSSMHACHATTPRSMHMQAHEFTHRERMTLAAISCLCVCDSFIMCKTQKEQNTKEETPEKGKEHAKDSPK